MGWKVAMRYRKGSQHGHSHIQEGQAGCCRNGKHQRYKDYKTNRIEHRDPHDKTCQHNSPLNIRSPETGNQAGSDPLGRTAFGYELAQHSPQAKDHHKEPEGAPDTVLNGTYDCRQGHTFRYPHHK